MKASLTTQAEDENEDELVFRSMNVVSTPSLGIATRHGHEARLLVAVAIDRFCFLYVLQLH